MIIVEKKIALFGGTFDPVHPGHVAVAANASEQIGAEKTIFIPAQCSPLKAILPTASNEDRLKMIALAIKDHKGFELSDHELKKDEPSFSLETVRHFKSLFGSNALIYWLVGADTIDDLWQWYGIVELIDECNLCVMYRAGFPEPDLTKFVDVWGLKRVEKLQQNIIQTPLIDISSTQIRSMLSAGEDISGIVDPAVAQYIYEHGLYK